MSDGLREGFYKIDDPHIIAVKLDDKRLRGGYRDSGMPYDTVYIPDDVFVRDITTLKGGLVNIGHNDNQVVGSVVDVIQNKNGIKGKSQIVPADGEELGSFFAIVKINNDVDINSVLSFKGSSGEYTILEAIDNYKVDNIVVDRYVTKVKYTGLALTNKPRSSEATVILNSLDKKTLDNEKTTLLNKTTFIKTNMAEITPELKEAIENACKNVYNSYEEEKVKNAEAESKAKEYDELKNTIKNISERMEAIENSIKNQVEEKKAIENQTTETKEGQDIKNSTDAQTLDVLLQDKKMDGVDDIKNSTDNGRTQSSFYQALQQCAKQYQ